MSDAPVAPILFADFALTPLVAESLIKSAYTTPTPIQAQTIPLILEGRDVVGQAQTGTGKTAAFALPLLSRLDLDDKSPQVLVLTPTRELAIQVAEAFQRYGHAIKALRVAAIYGGQGYQPQNQQLRQGVHVVVGTPGRVMDHMRRGTLNLDGLQCLVLDEADEMLRMGFIDDVEWVLTQTPAERQITLFSATMPAPIRRIAQQHLREPVEITIEQQQKTADTIQQRFMIVRGHEKFETLTRLLETEVTEGVIVFARTRAASVDVADRLALRGYSVSALNGDMPQANRERTIDQLRSGRLDIIVATDVAARGLDVQRISHVINYDFPGDSEAYVHRIGRTGRAGRSGQAILLLTPKEKSMLRMLERETNQRIEMMQPPSVATLNEQRVMRFKQRITDAMNSDQLAFFTQLIESYQTETELPLPQIAAALAALVQGKQPLLLEELVRHNDFPRTHDSRHSNDQAARGPRDGQPHRGGRPQTQPDAGMERFRIEVGRQHGVKPGNIVGAIANEAGLGSRDIGRIDIFDRFSTVDLPEAMPRDIFHSLKRVRIAGQQLRITRFDSAKQSVKHANKRLQRRAKSPTGTP